MVESGQMLKHGLLRRRILLLKGVCVGGGGRGAAGGIEVGLKRGDLLF